MSAQPDNFDSVIDIQTDRIVVFDQDLKTISSSFGLRKLFKKNYRDKDSLDSKPIEFYAPDLDELGIMRSFDQIAHTGGQFIVDRYYTVTDCIQYPFWDKICAFGYQSHVYTIHYNTAECSNEEAQIKVVNETAQHAANAISDKSRLMDYLYTLSNSGLDVVQQKLVDNMLSTLCAPTMNAVELLGKESGFSSREQQVANLVSIGKTTAEIASLLYITPKTVDFHRSNIRKKLHLDNRISLYDFFRSL